MRDQQLDVLALRVLILILALSLAMILRRQRTIVRRARILLRHLSQRPWLTGALIVVLSLTIDATLTTLRYPLPWTHDEFSYLLAGDMYANGQVRVETHPLWQHFETFHVLHQPYYASKYPPGNGIVLAIGQILTGHPIVGVWLCLAAACAATYWMFRAWLPSSWATLAGLLVAINDPIHEWWGQTYWGGAVAMLGGSLMFGAIRRVCNRPRLLDGVLLASGLLILANSRPMEGFLAATAVFATLVLWLVRPNQVLTRVKIRNVVLPLATIGGLGIAAMLAYNNAVTGDPLMLPYKLHDQRYSASSLFIWKTAPDVPQYNHERFRELYVDWARKRQMGLGSVDAYRQDLVRKAALLLAFFPIGWGICLPAVPFRLRGHWTLLASGTILVVIMMQLQLTTSWIYPHYLAPVACLIYFLCFEGLRHLSSWKRSVGIGPVLAGTVVLIGVFRLVTLLAVWTTPGPEQPRDAIERKLSDDGERHTKHLVIISYSDDYPIFEEWVYNQADIDVSHVVWARDMGRQGNQPLIDYYSTRKIWVWHAKPGQHELTPYN